MSTLPLKKEFVEAAIKARLKAIMVDMPQYRCLVGIPGGQENTTQQSDESSIMDKYAKAERNVQKLGLDKNILKRVYLTLLKNEHTPDTDIATYAAKLEFGSYSENIPPRPFLRTTFEGEKLEKIKNEAQRALTQCAKQNRDAKGSLEKIGLYAAGEVRKNIKNGDWADNSDVTKAIKGSDKPLIDTGEMSRAVTAWIDTNIDQVDSFGKK
jgi:hypothetical protein